MTMQVRKGQKTDILRLAPHVKNIFIDAGWQAPSSLDIDVAAFLLEATGKVRNDSSFVFYGNPQHNSGAVQLLNQGRKYGVNQSLQVNLWQVPANAERIAFTATIYAPEERRQSFGKVQNMFIAIVDANSNQELLRYTLESGLTNETAIVLGELYRYKGSWKFNAIGEGYRGGLEALCKSFGLEVSDQQEESRHISSSQQQMPAPPKKVELRKGQKVSLVKRAGGLGEISINLNWNTKAKAQKQSGFFSSLFGSNENDAIDLDLGCLFELSDGRRGVVQALGNSFGSLDEPPYISLDGDDRSGNSQNGETLRVNGKMTKYIRRILVFTYIYEGVANWKEANAVVRIHCQGSPEIVIRMDEYGSDKIMCALAMLENDGNGTFSVEKLIRFFNGHSYLDKAYNWGLRWKPGRKD